MSQINLQSVKENVLRHRVLSAVGTLLLAVVVATLVFGLSDKETAVAPPEPTPNRSVTMKIGRDGFEAAVMTVQKNTTVVWTNDDDTEVQIVSNPTGKENQELVLGSSALKEGESFSYTFTNVGTYQYHDANNPEHNGTIYVSE